MCQTISQNRVEIKEAVTAIAEIDVFRAKAKVAFARAGRVHTDAESPRSRTASGPPPLEVGWREGMNRQAFEPTGHARMRLSSPK